MVTDGGEEKVVWQLCSCPMTDTGSVQKLLEDSWEPFSTVIMAEMNPLNPREIKQVPVVFLKRGLIVDKTESDMLK